MDQEFNTEFEIAEEKTPEEKKKLDVKAVFVSCFQTGWSALIPVAITVTLWLVTVWIPYVNIGTTVALLSLPVWMAAGKRISPIDLFLGEHRAKFFPLVQMGGGFFVASFVFVAYFIFARINLLACSIMGEASLWDWICWVTPFAGVATAFFMIVTAWAMAPFLIIDKGMDPREALRASFTMTDGVRRKIFVIYAVPLLVGLSLMHVLGGIAYVGWIFRVGVSIAMVTAVVGLSARIYSAVAEQTERVEEK